MRELELVALAHEHAERAVALARRRRRRRGSAGAAARARPRARPRASWLAERRGDVLGRDAERAQPPLDPLGAPGVEPPAVVGEAPREGGVVDEAALEQLADDDLGLLGRDALLGQDAAQLELGAVAPVERAPGKRPRALQARRGIREPLARGLVSGAVCSSIRSTDSARASRGRRCRGLGGSPASRRRRRARSGSRGPGRCRARRRSWTRSPWRPRGARRGTPWRCARPWPSRSSP